MPDEIDGIKIKSFNQNIKNFTDLESMSVPNINSIIEFGGEGLGSKHIVRDGETETDNFGATNSDFINTIGLHGSGASVELPNKISNLNITGCNNLVNINLDLVGSVGGFWECTSLEAFNTSEYGVADLSKVSKLYYIGNSPLITTIDFGENRNSDNLSVDAYSIGNTITSIRFNGMLYESDNADAFNTALNDLGICEGQAWDGGKKEDGKK